MESNDTKKIVFFFGAGASAVDNAPLASQLLGEALKLGRQNRRINIERLKNVETFLKKVYCYDPANPTYPTFEEVLSPVDIAIQRNEGFSKDFDLYDLKKLKIDLIYCICEVLREKLRRRAVYHPQFVNNLFNDNMRENCYAFLSSNYDVLLDQALRNSLKRNIYYIDYGFKFINEEYANNNAKSLYIKVPLLKLHGSLNWKYYPYGISKEKQGEGIEITDGKASFNYYAFEPYSNSPDSLYAARPLIIPPTYIKNYDNKSLEKVWERASKELENASKIFFIGYSMPDSDFHIKHLMLRSLSRANQKPKIFVVGRKGNNIHSQPYENYKRIFGNINPLPIGFEGFIQEMHQYI